MNQLNKNPTLPANGITNAIKKSLVVLVCMQMTAGQLRPTETAALWQQEGKQSKNKISCMYVQLYKILKD